MSSPFILPLPPDVAERLSSALAVEVEAALLRLGHARKPSVALRIPAEQFRLVLKPTFRRSREGLLSPTGEVDCELLHGDAWELRARITRTGTIDPRRWWKNADRTTAACETFLLLLRSFLDDPAGAISGGSHSTTCGICRRRLVDAVSVARGIGPECLGPAGRIFLALRREAA